jgi:DNA segregation ATPase FtsK/SpoIIIE-like protein
MALINNDSNRLRKVSFNTAWFFSFVLLCLLLPSLLTHSMQDSSWSKDYSSEETKNIIGVFGAYFSDILYYLFGYSAYLNIVLLLVIVIDMWRRANDNSYTIDSNKKNDTNFKQVLKQPYKFDLLNLLHILYRKVLVVCLAICCQSHL